MNKSQLLLLKMVATFLINKNGSTTTLEIKNTLRERFPDQNWTQDEVSLAMMDIYDNQEFSGLQFEDTGDFRVYHMGLPTLAKKDQIDPNAVLNTPPVGIQKDIKPRIPSAKVAKPVGTTSKLSRTDIVELMRESKGRFYTVTFTKTDGSERTMNGQTKKGNFMDNMGYINFRESNGNIRRVNPKTIKEISISGNVYKVK